MIWGKIVVIDIFAFRIIRNIRKNSVVSTFIIFYYMGDFYNSKLRSYKN